jgi:acetyltransferase-like isoleucine patch superfamily enzyme
MPSRRQIVRYLKGRLVTLLWRARGVDCADRVSIEGRTPHLETRGSCRLGSRILFRTLSGRTRIGVGPRATLEIGARCFFNGNVQIQANRQIVLGDHCLVGENVRIGDTAYHEVDEGAGVGQAPILIGRNVWIANDATILPGVTIGDHSVVAAGSVVTRSFGDRCLVGGVPARKIRDIRASEDYVRR